MRAIASDVISRSGPPTLPGQYVARKCTASRRTGPQVWARTRASAPRCAPAHAAADGGLCAERGLSRPGAGRPAPASNFAAPKRPIAFRLGGVKHYRGWVASKSILGWRRAMEHKTLSDLGHVADFVPEMPSARLTRCERLEQWAHRAFCSCFYGESMTAGAVAARLKHVAERPSLRAPLAIWCES